MISLAQHCDKCKTVTSHILNKSVVLCLKCKKETKLKSNENRNNNIT